MSNETTAYSKNIDFKGLDSFPGIGCSGRAKGSKTSGFVGKKKNLICADGQSRMSKNRLSCVDNVFISPQICLGVVKFSKARVAVTEDCEKFHSDVVKFTRAFKAKKKEKKEQKVWKPLVRIEYKNNSFDFPNPPDIPIKNIKSEDLLPEDYNSTNPIVHGPENLDLSRLHEDHKSIVLTSFEVTPSLTMDNLLISSPETKKSSDRLITSENYEAKPIELIPYKKKFKIRPRYTTFLGY
jgi:hypothetical protein